MISIIHMEKSVFYSTKLKFSFFSWLYHHRKDAFRYFASVVFYLSDNDCVRYLLEVARHFGDSVTSGTIDITKPGSTSALTGGKYNTAGAFSFHFFNQRQGQT